MQKICAALSARTQRRWANGSRWDTNPMRKRGVLPTLAYASGWYAISCRSSWLFLDPEEVVGRLNRMLRGWANYFRLGTVNAAYRIVDRHACFRLRQWLGRRERVQGSSRAWRYVERNPLRAGLVERAED